MIKTTNTQTHMSVDEKMREGYTKGAMEAGFGAASGVRPETAASGGRITREENKDGTHGTGKVPNHLDDENSGLADS